MSHWQVVVLFVVGVILAFPLAIAISVAVGFVLSRLERCPKCGRRGLKLVNGCLATTVVNGRRAADSWFYYVCESCKAELKRHRGKWKDISFADRHFLANRSQH